MMRIRQARFVKVAALLSLDHLGELLTALEPLVIARTGALLDPVEIFLEKNALLEPYAGYIGALEGGLEPDSAVRPFLSTTLAPSKASFTIDMPRPGRCIARVSEPCIQLRYHTLAYSPIDHSFHSMAFGKETIPWGIEFSFAGLIQRGGSVEEVDRTLPAAAQFRTVQKWLRHKTQPALFSGDGWQRRSHVRISPSLIAKMNSHPALEGLEVA